MVNYDARGKGIVQMTLGQQRAIAVANARLRMQQAPAPAPVAAPVPAESIPRPDTTTGPTAGMDPFARTGYLMGTPEGQQAMAQTGQVIKNMGFEGGLATAGQIIGAPFEEVGGIHALGAAGAIAGNALSQYTTPGKKFSVPEMLAAGPMGAVPGAPMAKAGLGQLLTQGVKYGAANVIGANIKSIGEGNGAASPIADAVAFGAGAIGAPISKFLDSGSMANAASTKAGQDSVRRETLKAGQELGLVIPPSAVNPNIINDSLQSLAGKAATAQESIIRNQPKINAAVRTEIGLPESAPLSPIAINTQRVAPNLVYEQIGKSSQQARDFLDQFKQSTSDANDLFAAYRSANIKDPSILAQARAKQAEAEIFKGALKTVVPKPLYDQFDAARVQLAKIGMVDRAVRLGDGNVDAKVFGDALEAGEKLTGNLLKIGRFQSAFGRYVKEAATTPPSGVDYLKLLAKGGMAGAAIAKGEPSLAVAAPLGLYAAERGARAGILSPGYQSRLAQPFYGAGLEDAPAAVSRLSAAKAGREEAPLTEDELKRYNELKQQLGK